MPIANKIHPPINNINDIKIVAVVTTLPHNDMISKIINSIVVTKVKKPPKTKEISSGAFVYSIMPSNA